MRCLLFRFVPRFLATAAFAGIVFAQAPVGNEIIITLDHPANVGSQTLSPGEYTIRQVTSADNPRVLEFTTDHGTKLEATVTAVPIFRNDAPGETKVIFDNEGGTPRIDRIWVQGLNYGYEFPGKNMAGTTSASTNSGVQMEARFTPAPAPAAVAQNTPAPAPEPRAEPQRAEPQLASTPQPAPAAPQPEQPAAQTPEPAPAATLPATALGWGNILLTGLTLLAIARILSIVRQS